MMEWILSYMYQHSINLTWNTKQPGLKSYKLKVWVRTILMDPCITSQFEEISFFEAIWILFKIETTNSYVRNCHICRKSFLEIMKLTNKWLMELFLQADDPNYFSCFKFMCHNHHNQLCLMILRHKIHIIRIFIYITMKRNHLWIRVSTFT